MNIQQFQYILALAELRHFEKAAEKCCITQSTLSTMVSRFEEEIGIKVFDRKKKPVAVTAEGAAILDQLKKIDKEIAHLKEIGSEIKGEVKGNLSISVIPTIAPFILPLFLHDFAAKFPALNIEVKEETTAEILRRLKSRELDLGILSIPVKDKDIIEHKLYDEPFVFYDAGVENEPLVSVKSLDLSNMCLLEEGHCMRNQVLELCNFHDIRLNNALNFNYKAGSIDSLLRFVKANKASTLLPHLSAIELDPSEARRVSRFQNPVPYRSVGLVVHRHFVKHKLLEMLQQEILAKVAPLLPYPAARGKGLSPL